MHVYSVAKFVNNQKMNTIHFPTICEGIGPSPIVGLNMDEKQMEIN